MNKIVLITGATSGIGKACAIKFAREKHKLIITRRRENRLRELASWLTNKYDIEVYSCCFDVQDRKSVFKTIDELPETWKKLMFL